MTYTIGSLFSGIGGFDYAFVQAGKFDIRWQVEIDPFCQKVLKKHASVYWPNARMYNDVRAVRGCDLEPVDVVVGGVPCQPASSAGKRLGQQDERWLWNEAIRIVKEVKPRFVLFENVSGLRSLNGGDSFREILGGLAEAGFDVEWFHLRASDIGAPHRRERVFIVAHAASSGRLRQLRDTGDCERANTQGQPEFLSESTVGSQSLADDNGQRQQQPQGTIPAVGGWAEHGGKELVNASGSGRQERHTPAKPGFAGHASGRLDSRQGAMDYPQSARCESERVAIGDEPTHACAVCAGVMDDPEHGRFARRDQLHHQSTDVKEPNGARPQSGVCRITDGLPAKLDTIKQQSRWPSRPGEAQHYWEAPRVAASVKQRPARLKALGNSVVLQVVIPIAEAIWQALETEDNAATAGGR